MTHSSIFPFIVMSAAPWFTLIAFLHGYDGHNDLHRSIYLFNMMMVLSAAPWLILILNQDAQNNLCHAVNPYQDPHHHHNLH